MDVLKSQLHFPNAWIMEPLGPVTSTLHVGSQQLQVGCLLVRQLQPSQRLCCRTLGLDHVPGRQARCAKIWGASNGSLKLVTARFK
jgi:hypothetical protein